MTPLALFQLAGRISLFLFGIESIWCGIWGGLLMDQLPQYQTELWRKLFPPWSWRSRLWVLAVCTCFGVALMVGAFTIPAAQFTTGRGVDVGISGPFWLAAAVAIVRYTILELRLASRLRRQQVAERADSMDHSSANWTDR